ncbi:MAG TPA: alcohol dehydrogenase catalytic domain-containing protein [Methylomirabilota bacterium]|nr:alcohol dehydrogenase catalytic domain-containing protein [Methylomirabilota bacterium]
MKAIVFHGPGDLRYEELPIPRPGAGELVIKVEAALTCGTDVKTFRRGHPVMIPVVPTVFGHECAGRVVEIGRGVAGFRVGDRVVPANSAPCALCRSCMQGHHNLCDDLLFFNGAFGEYLLIPARVVQRNLARISQDLPAARAAFAEPLACSLLAVERAQIEAGESVAVFGHGPLGALLALLALHRKARVIVVGKSGWRLDRVRALGWAECVDALEVPGAVRTLRDLTDGHGVDVAIDATGQPRVWEQTIHAVGKGGTVVFFGGCAPGTSITLDTRRVHYEALSLLGSFHHTPEMIQRALGLLESGAVIPDPLISHEMDVRDVPDALKLMSEGRAMKVVIHPGRE